MTHTRQFIEDAVAGGWQEYDRYNGLSDRECQLLLQKFPQEALIDPTAWQAVGKTRGWDKETAFTTLNHDNVLIGEDAAFLKNREFLEHLWDGKTVEEALQAISE